jgi:hypothetical protein
MKTIQIDPAFRTDEFVFMLKERLPEFRIIKKSSQLFVAKKSLFSAAIIIIHKQRITIQGNFPGWHHAVIFALITVMAGIIIPTILYVIFIRRKFVRVENEVADVLRREAGQE